MQVIIYCNHGGNIEYYGNSRIDYGSDRVDHGDIGVDRASNYEGKSLIIMIFCSIPSAIAKPITVFLLPFVLQSTQSTQSVRSTQSAQPIV